MESKTLKRQRGFTIIELVIVTAILMLLTGGAVSNFQGFNDKQKVTQAVADLKSNLRSIQTDAINGVKPNSLDPYCQINDCTCHTLIGYSVTMTGSNYVSQALCNNGSGDVLVGPSTSVDLPSSISISVPAAPIIFYSLTKGVSSALSLTITGKSSSQSITISPNGIIDSGTPTPTPLATATPTASPTASPTPTPIPVGDGLKGDYYDNKDLTNLKGSQTDATINFDWGSGRPPLMTNNDTFSIRWTGYVLTTVAGSYKFFVDADDGKKLWVNNQLIIDKWGSSGEHSAEITLAANQKYAIKLEYKENSGSADCKLKWKIPGGSKVIIPQSNLFTSP